MTEYWTIFICKFLKTDNINRILIPLTEFLYWYFSRSDLGLGQSDHINRMITLMHSVSAQLSVSVFTGH